MTLRMKILTVLLMVSTYTPALAQDVQFSGQIRPRYETRDPSADGGKQFTSMRLRATMWAALERNVSVTLQMQDVRFWGEEGSTLGDFNADNLDMHQGFVDIGSFATSAFAVRVGRQEVNFGGQRLVGAVGWTQQARSFDGVRVQFRPEWGTVSVVGFKTGETFGPTDRTDSEFYAAYAAINAGTAGTLDLYTMFDRARAATQTDQGTLGARLAGKKGRVSYRGELSVQTGERADVDVSAYMFGARVGLDVHEGKGTITLWYDYLSGDSDPTDSTVEVFDTRFATNHKFYGFADLFLNIPVHTAGGGLQDFAIKGALRPAPGWFVGADLHTFSLAEKGALDSSHLGEEIDITVRHVYTSNLTFTGGFSAVFQDDTFEDIGRLSETLKWGYLMLTANF